MQFKLTKLSLGLLSLSSFFLGGNLGTGPAAAQCVQADVSIQYNISGSKSPTKRTNDVTMASDERCVGNASFTSSEQGTVGGSGLVEQRRQVTQRQSGGTGNPTGINGPTVQIRSNSTADVYNPVDNIQNIYNPANK